MGDRSPISTIPGLCSGWVGEIIPILPSGTRYVVSGFYLQRNGNQAGDEVVVRVAIENAGTPTNYDATIPDGDAAVWTDVGGFHDGVSAITLEVQSADTNSENLRGYILVDPWQEFGGDPLTSLSSVKLQLGITGSTQDNLLTDLLVGVTEEIHTELGRVFAQNYATDVAVDSIGRIQIALPFYPVISFTALTEAGTALVEGTDYECVDGDTESGLVTRISGTTPIAWARGRRVVRVDYTHGYASIPFDVSRAAAELVAFDYYQTKPGGERLGLTSKVVTSGGDSGYLTREAFRGEIMDRLARYRVM